MIKRFIFIVLTLLLLASPSHAVTMAKGATALTGGDVGALDSYDGSTLNDGDMAFVSSGNNIYIYRLDVDSALTESSPSIISPDSSAGDKRWILQSYGPFNLISSYGNDLDAAIATISATETELFIDAACTVSTSTTAPSTLYLNVLKPGSISIDTAKTLTIYSPANIKAAPNQHIFTGAGTVAFSSSGTVYPEWWGPNTTPGTTDMTGEVQAALDSMSTVTGTLRLINAYLVSSSIAPYDGMSVVGNDRGSSVTLAAASDVAVFSIAGKDGILLEGFKIDGNGSNQTGGATTHGINISASTDVTVNKVEVEDCYDTGIFISGASSDIKITNNFVHDTGSIAGNVSRGIWSTGNTDVSIIGNRLDAVDGFSITVQTGNDNAVVGNIITSTTTYDGIMIYGSDNNVVSSNKISGSGDTGIVLELSDLCAVVGNVIRYSDIDGIVLAGSTFNTVIGNTILNSSQDANDTHYGIRLSVSGATTSNNNIVSNNTILDAEANKAKYGIGELATNVPNKIFDNSVSGQVTGPFFVSTDPTFVNTDTTPSVAWGNAYKTGNAGATNITDLDDGVIGQVVTIIGADGGNSTFVHNAALMNLAGGANFTPADGDTLILVYDGTDWNEISRSDNTP